MYKAILFDFDGTLVQSMPLAVQAINHYAKQYHYNPIIDAEKARHKSALRLIREDLGLTIPGFLFRSMFAVPKIMGAMKDAPLVPDLDTLLLQLATKYKLGIVDSASERRIYDCISRYSLPIQHVVADPFKLLHKDQLILDYIIRQDFIPQEVLYVGDEVRDIEACKKIHLDIAAVTWGYNSTLALEKARPNFVVDRPQDLGEILR